MARSLPANPLAAYRPSTAEPWDRRKVGHLYRRATFGASASAIAAGLKQSPAQLVDSLLNYDTSQDPFNETLASLVGFIDMKEARNAQGWWLHRMLNTPRPLQEKIALFWHNRFATSAAKVGNAEMLHQQIELFRQKGLGNFRDLLVSVGRDPAMLVWLDGRENRKGKPNENYAREVMELFTLGIGNYTEKDVQELARCFTGWTLRDNSSGLAANLFDDGEKTVFGKTGKFNDEQAVDLLLSQPAALQHLSQKLLQEFVHPEPDAALVKALAERVIALKWELKPILRELLLSRVFFSDYAYRSRIKSPTELAVGSALAMGGKIQVNYVREQMSRMGQSLLYPPNVKGWDGGENWINSNTLLVRYNFTEYVALQPGQAYAKGVDFTQFLKDAQIDSFDKAVDHFAAIFLDGQISPELRKKMLAYVSTDEKDKDRKFDLQKADVRRAVRSMAHMLMSTPEYQLA